MLGLFVWKNYKKTRKRKENSKNKSPRHLEVLMWAGPFKLIQVSRPISHANTSVH